MEEKEIIYDNVSVSEMQDEVIVEEVIQVVTVSEMEGHNIDLLEAFPAFTDDIASNHALLNNRELNDQHPISAITGLRAELDAIKSLKTIYSNKRGIANYYKWADAAYDSYGYFVSMVPHTSAIKICDGSDILGVSVADAGFVGGQDEIARDNAYGLIATSGLVNVRCELDVEVGDYVVSNIRGYAKKAESNYGYKVLEITTDTTSGETYAVISLDVQADVMNALGVSFGEVKEQVDANYKNIISAINVANQAYNKANEVVSSNQVMSDKVDEAVGKVDDMVADVENLETQISNSAIVSAQAKAIAESAATSAASMKDEAIASANNVASQVGELTKTLEPLTAWVDPVTGNKGASYLANYIDNGLATKTEIETVEDDLEHATSAISKNAKSLRSLVVSIDKYSVGEYSTAYGLTLEQATDILEEDIIYVPTINKLGDNKETYTYIDEDGESQVYSREFSLGYLYRWGLTSSGRYGWITVDSDYSAENLNTSAPAVYFSPNKIEGNGGFGYWYTEGSEVAEGYEPYTLYKWEEDQWIAVATLAGNVNNRAISQIRQEANSISLEVTNARGSAATLGARITNTETEIQTLTTWTKDASGNQYNLATIKQTADNAGADIALVVQEVDGEKVVNAASIVAAINDDGSNVGINADRITMTGTATFLKPDDLGDDGTTEISGNRITTGELDAEKVKVINLQASSIVVAGSGNKTVDEALADTLVSSTIYYALSTSTKTPPSDDAWSKDAPEKERKKYMWQKTVNVYGDGSVEESAVCIAGADGESAITVEIMSATGTIYVNSDIQTILTARVFQDNVDITDEFPDEAFLWEKCDMYGIKDTVWSYLGKAITVNNLDIYKRAMFNCTLDVEQRI